MGRHTGPSKATVETCWKRADGSCENCHRGLSFGGRGMEWSLHHRQPRGMGGSTGRHVNLPANLLVLCGSGTTGCHGWVESNRETALGSGLLVSRLSPWIPAMVPVVLAGVSYWLDDYGGKVLDVPPPFGCAA